MNTTESEDLVVLYFELERRTRDRLTRSVKHGMRRFVMAKVTEMICDAAEEHGDRFLGAVLTGSLKFSIPDNVHNVNGNYEGTKQDDKKTSRKRKRTRRSTKAKE